MFPEADPSTCRDAPFRFVDSRIRPEHKRSALLLFRKLWDKRFESTETRAARGLILTDKQLSNFEADLSIVFEAGYACHSEGVLDEDDFITPALLTNNMRFVRKFIRNPETEELLEDVINLCGFEHLLPVQPLEDALDAFEATSCN